MKKRLLIIFLVFIMSLCFNLKSNASYSESLPVSNSTSYNLLNPEYIRLNNGVISYEGRIQYKTNTKYYLGISGVETDNDASVLIETSTQGSKTLNRVKAIKFIFLLDFTTSGGFTSLSNNTNTLYFTISDLKCDALTNMSLETLKSSMYVRKYGEGSLYSLYVDDTNTPLSKDKAIVTSTDNKLDLNELGKKIIINNVEGSATLKDDGGYNTKYQTAGVYTVKYEIKIPNRILTSSLSIYVFEKATCDIEGPDILDFETVQNFEGFYTFEEYIRDKYSVSYGGRDVTLGYSIFNPNDSNHELKFKDVILTAGEYILLIEAYYNGSIVKSHQVSLIIENDEEVIEVYFPEVLLTLTTLETYNDTQLCAELEKTLKLLGLNVSNVCILNSEYSESVGAGEYNVYYSYEIENKSYFNKAIIKVEEDNNTSDEIIDINPTNKKLTGASIALISISSVLVILVVGYLIIRLKRKH